MTRECHDRVLWVDAKVRGDRRRIRDDQPLSAMNSTLCVAHRLRGIGAHNAAAKKMREDGHVGAWIERGFEERIELIWANRRRESMNARDHLTRAGCKMSLRDDVDAPP